MADSLFHAYGPLLFWTGLGWLTFRFLPDTLPRLLGRSLYWVGVPLEILALARQTHFTTQLGVAPLITAFALIAGLLLSWLSIQVVQRSTPADPPGLLSQMLTDRPPQGSFMLASMLGNTGFVGLAVVPVFVDTPFLSWLIFYSVTQNVIGTYGLGVLLSSYFGRPEQPNRWWTQVRDILTVPSLWAFVIGSASQSVALPDWLESSLQGVIWLIIPLALALMGMRLSQLQGWKSLRLAIVPMSLKSIAMPLLVGLVSTLLGLTGDARLALVLMAGMPTAFAGLILAEEYNLDRELIASSILLTSIALVGTIPIWLVCFG